MAARKKSSTKKPESPAAKDAEASGNEPGAKPAAAEKPAKKASAGKGKFKAQNVTLPHLFSLRPRVETSFPQDQFRAARQDLEDERYESLEEAARAVAAKALELTRDPASKKKKKGRRRG